MGAISTAGYGGVGNRNEYYVLGNTAFRYVIDGGGGTDAVFTTVQNDYIVGGTNRDVIYAGGGNDVVVGDRFWNDDVVILADQNAGAGADAIFGGAGNDIVYAGGGNNWVSGEAGDDTVTGGSGSEFLQGGAGNDTIYGLGGNDVIYGGTASVNQQTTAISAYFGTPGTTWDFNGVTDAAETGNFSISIDTVAESATGNDYLDGGAGNDAVYGQDGNDFILGGAGADQIDGGAGGDFINGGDGIDNARYDGSLNGVVVRLDSGVGVGGDAQDDTLVNVEGVIGSAQQDYLIGDAITNYLFGQDGNDWLYGQAGNDQLFGGTGSDQMIGGSGVDTMAGGAGNDQFWTLAADFQAGVYDTITDFGETNANFDFLRFEGIGAAQLIIADNGGNAVITTNSLNFSGGIIILNFSSAQMLDQLIFA